MRIGDRLIGPFLAAFGVLVIWGASKLPSVPGVRFGADLLPTAIGVALAVFGVIIGISGLRQRAQLIDVSDWHTRLRDGVAALWSLVGLVIGILAFEPLGFPLFGIGFMAVMMALMGARWPVIVTVAPVFVFVLYFVFSGILRVSLPVGPLGGLLP